jgi:hypothetical protein
MMKKQLLTFLGVGAACAACCAPLLAPLLAGTGLAGFGAAASGAILGLSLDTILCGAVALAAIAGTAIWLVRRKPFTAAKPACDCEGACSTESCSPNRSQPSIAAGPKLAPV